MTTQTLEWPKTFKASFCEVYRCPAQDYERRVFWKCVYRHTLPLALLIYWIKPDFFYEDFDTIREVGLAKNTDMFMHDVNLFYSRNLRHGGFIRGTMMVRISGQRLLNLKNNVLRAQGR